MAKTETKRKGAAEPAADGPLLDMNDASVKRFIKAAKARGYVTYDELNKVLPSEQVSSEQIGHLVMEGLRGLDTVAFVRFASVYKNFREAKDFEEFVGELAGGPIATSSED